MKRLLVVFSYKYPFSPPVEQFLHEEMPYHNNKETDIWIVPSARNCVCEMQYNRPQMSRVSIIPLKRKQRFLEFLLGLLGSFVNIRQLIQESFSIVQDKNISHKRAFKSLVYTNIQSEALLAEIRETLDLDCIRKYDEVLLYSYWFNAMASAISLYRRYLKRRGCVQVRAIARAHGQGDLYPEFDTGLYRPNRLLLNSELNAIYSISEEGSRFLSKQKLTNVKVSKLGVPLVEDFPPKEIEEIPTIVSCSVINQNKRVLDIAKAVARIKQPVRWIHFGSGPNECELKNWCELNMTSNIKWELRGWTANVDVLRFYKVHVPEVFINLSRIEGIPVSIMEAMSYGIPCVATKSGASQEIVRPGENGFLVDVEFTTEDVTAYLMNCLEYEGEGLRLGAYYTAKQEFCAQCNLREFANEIWQE